MSLFTDNLPSKVTIGMFMACISSINGSSFCRLADFFPHIILSLYNSITNFIRLYITTHVCIYFRWMCSNKGGSCMMCNCIIQHEPPSPTKSDIQLLCKECTNANSPNRENISELHITKSTSDFCDESCSSLPMTFNTTCGGAEEPKHDCNFPVGNNSRELALVIDQQVPQPFISPSVDHNNGTRKHDNKGSKVSCVDTTRTLKELTPQETLLGVDTPEAVCIDGVQKLQCETSV